jgi:peptidoglycan/LPS O-acetylase OafA/YrhL
MGVAMFFVISGYCLTASARSGLRRSESMTSFLYRRARRIYPPFWCSIVVVAAIPFVIEFLSSLKTGTYVVPTADNPHYGYLAYGFWDWLRVGTLTQAFYPSGQSIGDKFTSINAVYWSLAIEEQFYLVMALALICARRFYLALIAVTLAAVPFSFFPGAYRNGIFLPWWLMFSFGVGLYFAIEREWRPERVFGRRALPVAAAVWLLGVGGCWWYVAAGGHPVQQWFALFFAIGLWFAVVFDQPFNQAKQHRWAAIRWATAALVLLGTMSYSLYLIHGRLQYLVKQVVRQVLDSNTILFDGVVICLIVAACYPFYRLCEAPFFKPRISSETPPRGSALEHDAVQRLTTSTIEPPVPASLSQSIPAPASAVAQSS